ncbi:MAG TPA: hypothetical protein VD994_12450, partial [Prosthecobacter sp.]|nr:hypothetical protein [Prosthecobacter sp.]
DEALQESDPGLSFAAAVPPIVVMVRQLLPGSGYATKPGHLTVEIRSEPSAEAQRRKFEIELVLEDPATRRTWSLTPAKFLHASGSMSRMLPLPADLHKAPCHLRPRILEAGRFIANGHGPILDLP